MRPAGTGRYPTLADLMILTGATGVAVALLRPYLASLPPRTPGATGDVLRIQEGLYGCWSLVAAWWMLALLVIGRHRPRLAWRPGQVACLALTAGLAVGSMQLIVLRVLTHPITYRPNVIPYLVWIYLSNQVGPTILGAWAIQVASGRWRPDPGWVDRLGRLLGGCWVAWSVPLFLMPQQLRNEFLAWVARWAP